MSGLTTSSTHVGSAWLGMALTALLAVPVLSFFCFAAFSPQSLAVPLVAGKPMTVWYVYGLGLIVLPADEDERLAARKVEVVCDGVCDALVSRQQRKVGGELRALSEWVGDREWVIGDRFGLADIATGTVVKHLDVRLPDLPWRTTYPNLAALRDRLEQRPSFATTTPVAQVISDRVV